MSTHREQQQRGNGAASVNEEAATNGLLHGRRYVAGIDQPDVDGKTLRDATLSSIENMSVSLWSRWYADEGAADSGSEGLLPYRVWQIFDEMVRQLKALDGAKFLCAVGVLAHCLGDACQPLHGSYHPDGYRDARGATTKKWPGKGIHSTYEDKMVCCRRCPFDPDADIRLNRHRKSRIVAAETFFYLETVVSAVGMWVDTVSASTAVEAARAGANGRGFAVVAQEVRALAERSSSAAKEIDALIKGITTEVDLSSVAVNRAGSTIVDLIGAVNGVSQLVELIASASSEQSVGIDQVNAAVSTMDQMTQKNAAFAQDGVEAGSALEAQAQYLRSAVRAFRL